MLGTEDNGKEGGMAKPEEKVPRMPERVPEMAEIVAKTGEIVWNNPERMPKAGE